MRWAFGWRVLSRDQRRALLGGLGLLVASAALAWHWCPGNIGHHDTAYYLDGARHLARGSGFVSAESSIQGEKLATSNWPPGFSLLMVPGLWLGLSVHQSAALVLGASYSALLTSMYSLLLMESPWRHWPAALATCIVFGLTPSLLDMQNRLLSDLPMSAALMVAVAVSVGTMRSREKWRAGRGALLVAGALGFLLASVVLIRWAGMFAVAGLIASFCLFVGVRQARSLWREGTVMLGTTLLLAGGWMLRNWALTGETMGNRASRLTDPALHVERALGGMLLWATDVRDFLGGESRAWLAFGLLQLALLFLITTEALCGRLRRNVAATTLALTAATYSGGLLFSASIHPFNSLFHPRYWIFVWAVFLCVSFLIATRARTRFKWLLRGSFAVSLLTYAVVGSARYAERHETSTRLARTRAAPVQEIAQEMMQKDCHIISNDNRVLMVNDGYDELYRFPSSKQSFQQLRKRGPVCVVWIRPEGSSRRRTAPKQLKLLNWAAKRKYIRLDRKRGTYEVWLPGPS